MTAPRSGAPGALAALTAAPVLDRAGPAVADPPDRRPRVRSRLGALLVVTAVLVAVAVASLAWGARAIPLGTVVSSLAHGSGLRPGASFDTTVVLQERLPRTVAGLVAGVGLAVAGALMQAVTRNPLADPGLLGVNAGSAFAVALAVGVLGLGPVGYLWFAFAGALVAAVVVYLIGAAVSRTVSPTRLTLAGLALGAVLTGITAAMMLADPKTFSVMQAWQAGVLTGRPLSQILPALPFVAAGVVVAIGSGRSLNAVTLGDEAATALGVDVRRTRVLSILAITVLAGGATAVAGPITFIGLMVPHLARRIVGSDQRWIILFSVLLGPILLLSADVAGRVVLRNGELPAGVVTAVIGAPVLVWLARRSRVRGL